ncbi:MAG TPA: hypothetical protein VGC21_25015, partial [Telluria sp.]
MFQWLQNLFSTPAPSAAPARPAPVAPAPVARPAAAGAHGGPAFDQRDSVNARYYHWLFGTGGISEFDTSEPENQVLAALAAILASQQSGAALVRRLPGLIPQLLQSLRSDNFSAVHLSRTISSD